MALLTRRGEKNLKKIPVKYSHQLEDGLMEKVEDHED